MTDQLTFLSEEPPANHSASQDCEKDWMTTVATSPLNFVKFLKLSSRIGLFGKTSPACYPAIKDGTLPPSFQGFGNAGMGSPTEFLTLCISEHPCNAVGSTLSDILETPPPPAAVLFERQSLCGAAKAVEEGAQSGTKKTGGSAFFCFKRTDQYIESDVTSTLTARDYKDARDLIVDENGVRGLTPLEYERLMGFPDGWTDIQKKTMPEEKTGTKFDAALSDKPAGLREDSQGTEKSLCALRGHDGTASDRPQPSDRQGSRDTMPFMQHKASECGGHGVGDAGLGLSGRIRLRHTPDGPRYKAMGNSMAVPVMSWIGQRIDAVDKILKEKI